MNIVIFIKIPILYLDIKAQLHFPKFIKQSRRVVLVKNNMCTIKEIVNKAFDTLILSMFSYNMANSIIE